MAEPASPLLDDKNKTVPAPNYSEDETKYLGLLTQRFEDARTQRETPRIELDGMTYTEYWYANEKGANTFIEPKLNKEESNFQSGTIRDKLFAAWAPVRNLDLSPDVTAYDKNDLEAAHFGEVIEDVTEKTADSEVDEDKQGRRQYELLKQGDVFVEEVWDDLFIKDKNLAGSKTFDGKVNGVTWTTKLKRLYSGPCRNILCGLNVYLGDIRSYDLWKQPFIFTVTIENEGQAKALFEKWERWKNVPKDLKEFASSGTSFAATCIKLTPEITKGQYQVVRYQDKWNNEYAVIVNGVLMTPVGLPLPWGWNDYNIVQQGLEPIHEKFAYHGSIVKRARTNVAIYDELAKVMVLQAQKAAAPPRLNLSGRIISKRVFLPNAITSGINPGEVPPIDNIEAQGPNISEFNMLKFLSDTIDKSTSNPIFGGQSPAGDPTATEVLEVQRQAKMLAGHVYAAVMMLEWKLAWLRFYNIRLNWFKPTGNRVEGGRLVDQYRSTNVSRPIEGKGMGRRVTIPTAEPLPSPQEVYDLEEGMTQRTGVPHRFSFVDPSAITDDRLTWHIAIVPKEKRTSETARMLFNKMILDGTAIGINFNHEFVDERFANVWGESPDKLISKAPAPGMDPNVPAPASPTVSPKIVQPKPTVGAVNAAL